jgi:hypothetical protein
MNATNRDCTEFKINFNKSDYIDNFINALTFYFSDGSVEVFGTPGHIELLILNGTKMKRLYMNYF